jgi:pyruvate carboxylase
MRAPDSTRLFAYGTLRRGAPMHRLIEHATRFLGPASFAGRLFDLGDYPAVTDGGGRRDVVYGELYELMAEGREQLLDSIDRYEGRSFERVRREVTCQDGTVVVAFLYLFRGDLASARRVRSGDYLGA